MVIVNVILCLALISFFLSALVFCSTKTAPSNKTMKKSVVNCIPHFHIWVRLIFLPVLATSQKKEKGKKTQLMKQNFLKRSKTKSQVLPQCCTMQAALSPADLQCQMKSTRMQLFNIKKLDLWKPTFFLSPFTLCQDLIFTPLSYFQTRGFLTRCFSLSSFSL